MVRAGFLAAALWVAGASAPSVAAERTQTQAARVYDPIQSVFDMPVIKEIQNAIVRRDGAQSDAQMLKIRAQSERELIKLTPFWHTADYQKQSDKIVEIEAAEARNISAATELRRQILDLFADNADEVHRHCHAPEHEMARYDEMCDEFSDWEQARRSGTPTDVTIRSRPPVLPH